MRLLLDTHIFLWLVSDDPQLPQAARDAIQDANNTLYLSIASAWEVAIKHNLGKMPLPTPPATYIPFQRRRHGIASLLITESTLAFLPTLPPLHRDPFDRILICQVLEHGLTLVTVDAAVRAYAVPTL
jgi:PIN domain nuclease of toxin-antitoxin system